MSKISEFFGLNCNDDLLNFETAMSAQTCPYTQRICTKMRKSNPSVKMLGQISESRCDYLSV